MDRRRLDAACAMMDGMLPERASLRGDADLSVWDIKCVFKGKPLHRRVKASSKEKVLTDSKRAYPDATGWSITESKYAE